jgi:looped-hinge helix DNA binding domain, AbrB family
MHIVTKSKIGSRGQIVISKVARDILGLLEGSDVIIEMREGEIGIMPVKKDILDGDGVKL